jgi:signal peptidase I
MPGDRRQKTKRQFFDPRYVRNESRRSYRLAFILFWSILLFFVFQHTVICLGVVQDRSMLPQLPDGSTFLVNKYIYHLSPPQRGDVVVLARNLYMEGQFVKRVVGLPGETIRIHNGRVTIDGKLLAEPYAIGDTLPDFGPLALGADQYFVLGDNRMVSEDSRRFGSIPRSHIEGKIRPGKLFAFW